MKGSLAIKRLPNLLVQATMERRVAPLLMPPAERLLGKTSSEERVCVSAFREKVVLEGPDTKTDRPQYRKR